MLDSKYATSTRAPRRPPRQLAGLVATSLLLACAVAEDDDPPGRSLADPRGCRTRARGGPRRHGRLRRGHAGLHLDPHRRGQPPRPDLGSGAVRRRPVPGRGGRRVHQQTRPPSCRGSCSCSTPADGSTHCSQTLGTNGIDSFRGVDLDGDAIYVAGARALFGHDVPYVARLSLTDCSVQWNSTYKFTLNTSAPEIAFDVEVDGARRQPHGGRGGEPQRQPGGPLHRRAQPQRRGAAQPQRPDPRRSP